MYEWAHLRSVVRTAISMLRDEEVEKQRIIDLLEMNI